MPAMKNGLYDPVYESDSCGVGFICNIRGRESHSILRDAERMNCSMAHRGGVGYEQNTGDGSGILTGLPQKLLRRLAKETLGVDLPERGHYGVGNVFLPHGADARARCKRVIGEEIAAAGQKLIGWRPLPIDPQGADLGQAAKSAMPHMEQLFVGSVGTHGGDFERKLYFIRKQSTNRLRNDTALAREPLFYLCSLSSKTIVYKGMLTPKQTFAFYPDLNDPDYETHLAMVHSRFSTNTLPSWDRAQPNRFISHNGEINTILGNRNAMEARQGVVESEFFGADIKKLFPVIEPECSDSGMFDNVLEFLLMNGRTLQEAVIMMIPEAWQHHSNMDVSKRAFYEFHSCLMEPWDGPASIVFTDGSSIGAVLDRNGLRPSRYYITHDDKCIMASEVGVIEVDPSTVIEKGRLKPGCMFLIDFDQGRMIPDGELKSTWAGARPYAAWLKNQRLELNTLSPAILPANDSDTLPARMRAFGYTQESMQMMLLPLVKELRDPLGSMGNDAALAVMSDKPRMLYDYFKQRFAQVTNPAIDSIREELVMALETYIGPEQNLLASSESHCRRLRLPHPILSNDELGAIKAMDHHGWRACTIDMTYPRASGKQGLIESLRRMCERASAAIDDGYALLVLSDRELSHTKVPISSLFAVGAVHHHLIRTASRTRVGLVLESGEARDVHHHCLLLGYGADAINPYLAFEALCQAKQNGYFDDAVHLQDNEGIVAAYRKATAKGLLKVMAKMGISTLQSYKGAQIFEAVGLAADVMEVAFDGTASRVGGVSLEILAEEMQRRHHVGFPDREVSNVETLPDPGDFHWRARGDIHMWDPTTIANLQVAARTNSEEAYWAFAKQSNEHNTRQATLRGLLGFKPSSTNSPIPVEEVEDGAEIVKRFVTGAMSLGSISAETHETLAIAMNRIGGKSNTGEGGEDAKRFVPDANGDLRRSAIKQVASGRFGVTINYLANADELQIKIVQGAKPGEGGELPGAKVDDYIARIRHSAPGVGLISPPPHHDIYSIEDIAQLIHDLKNANPLARISVKLGAEVGVGTVASGVTKALADHLVIAGDTGGTGASPLTSIKHAGIPWELGIAETHQTLVMNNLRSRVVLQTDGQLKTGRDVAIAALLGAEEFGFSTAPLVALGCIMMRKCHLNTCPVGIATQDPVLRRKFTGEPSHVVNYLFMVVRELRQIMAELGFRTVNDMVGRVDVLNVEAAVDHWKARGLDLSALLLPAQEPPGFLGSYARHPQDHQLDKVLDRELISLAEPALAKAAAVSHEMRICNTNRVVGGLLSHHIIRRCGPAMLPDDTIHFKFNGSAGQSFGCWLAKGVTLEVEGDANDYVGKGLSGGKLIIYPPKESTFVAEANILIGNVVMYGATSGEAYFRGVAAERFCVRNSGASAVVEGVGDHGCEYMTGGRVVVLGPTGRNFAAGMSGGIAYIWDSGEQLKRRCNHETVDLESVVDTGDVDELHNLISNHFVYTNSTPARLILEDWDCSVRQFVKVMPVDYKQVLSRR